jgi:signal transduction histidine kinase/HAMP domain-containing protein
MAWLLPLLALVFAAVMFWLSTVPQDALYADNLNIVRRASRAAVHSVEASMPHEPGDHPWSRLTRIVAMQEGAWIRVVGSGGRIAFSNRPAATDTPPGLDDPPCAACHAGSPDPIPTNAIVRGPQGESFQVLAAPMPNREACRVCHETQGPNVGVVLAGQSVEPIRRVMRTIRLGIAVAGGVCLLLTLLTTRLVLGRLLGRPLRKLVAGAESIGAGDLSHPIELGDRTELTMLAEALNLSTSRLAEMVRGVERQRDEFETLYHFTDQMSRAVRPAERRLRAVELATRFLGAECVLVQADYQREAQTGQGAITLRGDEGFEDHAFRFGPDSREGVPPFLSRVIERWLKGEFDDTDQFEEGWIVGYPVQHERRHLGLLLLPAARGEDPEEKAPDPDLVRALCRHIAIALEFSEMQHELVAQERLAAIGETIAGLAHCLKNALNALRAGLFITDRALDRDDPKKLRRGWGITKVGIRQIEGLSLDMLYYVKERKPQRAAMDPNAVVGEVVDLLREVAFEKDVELRAELDERVGSELLDRTTIYRAILNLVTNAIDACTESETGNLVVVRTRSETDGVVLTVEDNGVGMTDDVRSRLFTRFFTTKAGKGTGLGLAVVRKIVEEHGGRVDVESEPGHGSSFHIRLPR